MGSGTGKEGGDRLRQKAASGASVTLSAHLLGRGLTFGFRLTASRVLGANGYGILALALAVSNLAGRFGAFGFDRAALRFGAEAQGKQDLGAAGRMWRASLLVAALGGITLAAAIWLFAPDIADYFKKSQLVVPLRALAVSIPFIALTNTGAASLQSVQRIFMMVLFTFIIPPAVALATLGFGYLLGWSDVTWAAIALGAGWGIAGLAAMIATLRASRGVGGPRFESRVARYAATVVLVTGTAQIVWYIDRFMLARFGTATDVGTYDVAATLALQIAGVLAALAPTFTALVGTLFFSEQKSYLQSLYQTATRWAVALTIPMFLVICFSGEPMLRLFGAEFADAHWVLVVLAAGQLVSTAAGSVGQILMMTNREGLVFLNNVLVGGLNIAGNYLLIPRYGTLGAALSTACSLSLMNLLAVVELWTIHRLQPVSRAWSRPFGAAILGVLVGALLTWALPSGLIGQLSAGTGALVTYFFVMWKLGLLPEDEAVVTPVLRRMSGWFNRS
jgi:O-antigen/teichoic acid export membrane protein